MLKTGEDPGRGLARRRLVSSAVVVVAAAALAAGCGVEGQDLTGDTTAADTSVPAPVPPVSSEDVAATEKGSPERTALQWWRDVQSRNTEAVEAAYTEKVRKDLPEGFPFSLVSYVAPLAGTATVSIESVEMKDENSDKATLYLSIDSLAPRIAGTVAIPMEKEGGEWLISDSTFLTALAGAINQQTQSGASGNSAATTTPSSG